MSDVSNYFSAWETLPEDEPQLCIAVRRPESPPRHYEAVNRCGGVEYSVSSNEDSARSRIFTRYSYDYDVGLKAAGKKYLVELYCSVHRNTWDTRQFENTSFTISAPVACRSF
ncbi:hypothetical protein RB195_010365 [Necator americanus]|uniref:ZP domain-containing protein n=1 Tax=Necator americanus TaxID=51031 RepID=A0ABR1CXM4_NECAM